jgi:trigger factor
MEVQVAETGPCSRALRITVPPKLVNEHLDQMYESARQQIHIKGFRPGKVPRELIQKRYGAGILAEAKEQMLNRFFGEACRSKDLSPVGRVAIDDVEKLEVKPDSKLEFTAKIDVRPVFEVKKVKAIEVDGYEANATEADIDKALQQIAHEKRSIQKTDTPAQDGDFVKADTTFMDSKGNVLRSRKGVQLNTRIAIHGTDEAAYTAALVGTVAGKSIEIPITFPETFENTSVRGQTGTVRVDALEVLRVAAPPIDDQLAKTLEFENLGALRADLQTRISQEKQRLGKTRQEEQCLQHLLTSHDIPVPPSLVEEQQRASLSTLEHRLKEGGASAEEVKKKLEEARGEAHEDAIRRVRLFFLIEAVARQQKLFVTETDTEAELRAIAVANSNADNQVTPAMVREHLERENRFGELRLALLERKVRDFLRDSAKIVDRKGS